MTYIQAPKDEPLNLNMAEFEKQPEVQNNLSIDEDTQKKDLEVINECMQRHSTFNGVM